jgi:hypothetical protein
VVEDSTVQATQVPAATNVVPVKKIVSKKVKSSASSQIERVEEIRGTKESEGAK